MKTQQEMTNARNNETANSTPKTMAEKMAMLSSGYVPEQITPAAKKTDTSFWATYDENDESGQL
jgi:hypothetical protein